MTPACGLPSSGAHRAADIQGITKQAPLFLSPVNLAEIRFGIELMTEARQKQRATAMFRRAKDFRDIPSLKFVIVAMG